MNKQKITANLYQNLCSIKIEHDKEHDWLTEKIRLILSELPGAQWSRTKLYTYIRLLNLDNYYVAVNEVVNAIVLQEGTYDIEIVRGNGRLTSG